MGGRLMRRPNPRVSGAFPLGGAISVEKKCPLMGGDPQEGFPGFATPKWHSENNGH
ncbi:MAG: hypothetical protein KatS3mg112_1424 [Thermogutta sp.]|nr:MAG: hypothetical protein KatS3mg112_1424 [Thermogutta sp.]